MSSRAELKLAAEDLTDGQRSASAISVSAEAHVIDISAPDGLEGDAGHEDIAHDQEVLTDQKEDTNEAGPSTTGLLGFQCAPPTVLPPSPPLTVADTRDGNEAEGVASAAASSSAQPANVTSGPPNMREEDITNWRASMLGRERGREENVGREAEREFEGEYDPYDLGYSPVTPVGPSANTGVLGGEAQSRSLASRQITDHPLRFDVHPPSPPPWEVISPSGASENVRTGQLDGTLRGYNAPKPMSVRLFSLEIFVALTPPYRSSRPQIPHSAYYFGPPPINSAYGTDPIGQIGVHHPREIIRVERDYSGGELIQFSSTYPLELEGRVSVRLAVVVIHPVTSFLPHFLR